MSDPHARPSHQARLGRPRKADVEARDRRVLDVATQVFLAHGYEGATLDDIAARAEVSKVTIYRRFNDKFDLFRRVVARTSDIFQADFTHVLADDRPVEDALRQVAELHLNLILGAPDEPSPALDLSRLLIAETSRFPDVARAALNLVHQSWGGLLQGYLQRMTDDGRLNIRDPEIASALFLNSLLSVAGLLVDAARIPTMAQRQAIVDEALRLFLYGAVPRGS
jgi:AcrR family transcriptional regulator